MYGGLTMEELGTEIDRVSNYLTDLRWELWFKYTLFTWQWWSLVLMSIISAVLYFRFIRKDKILSSFVYFGIIFILNKYLDGLATVRDWYDYRVQIEPAIPTMIAANLFVIPMGLSFIYQRYEKWKPFLIALVICSAFVSYVALPLMEMAHIYLPKAWKYSYSFIALILMGVLAKAAVDRAAWVQSQSLERNTESSRPVSEQYFRRKEKAR